MKTAVEWLHEEFTKTNHLTEDEFYMKFQQAKEMEKERIIMAYKADLHPCSEEEAEQYYNQTFKQEQ
jgi:cyclopropane fatty-acyl-phospholipid synthase-like methyltransferase